MGFIHMLAVNRQLNGVVDGIHSKFHRLEDLINGYRGVNEINSIIDLVKDLDTSRQTKNLNKLLIRILLHLQVEFSQ